MSDELDGGMNHSGEEEDATEKVGALGGYFGGQEAASQKKVPKPKKRTNKYKQEVDTNVFKINMVTLKDAAELATGDPV